MSEIKRYTVKIKYTTEHLQEIYPYAANEEQAAAVALKMFHDTVRNSESTQPKVIEVKEKNL